MDIVLALLTPLWLLWPAMVSNSFAAIFGGGLPMDFGKSWKGRRIFGDGKTWRGFIIGIFLSVLVGIAQMILSEPFSANHYGFGSYEEAIPYFVLISAGALLGDCMGAFVKRRLDIPRGGKAPGLDQYDFFIIAVLFAFIVKMDWFVRYFVDDYFWLGTAFLIILIPVLHRLFNIIGYKLGRKHVPW